MGGCCSCFGGSDDDGPSAQELELQAQKARKALSISAKQSAPTIQATAGGNLVSGRGLAIVGAALEQDAAYWEWHVSLPQEKKNMTLHSVLFGVSSKKDQKFYKDLEENPPKDEGDEDADGPSQVRGTQWMRQMDIVDGDVVGVAVQQSDLPMVQFTLNGDTVHMSAINRFKGTVYPSIYLSEDAQRAGLKVTLAVDENDFQHSSPGPRFGPIMVARSIV